MDYYTMYHCHTMSSPLSVLVMPHLSSKSPLSYVQDVCFSSIFVVTVILHNNNTLKFHIFQSIYGISVKLLGCLTTRKEISNSTNNVLVDLSASKILTVWQIKQNKTNHLRLWMDILTSSSKLSLSIHHI